jgi:diguanylate cyclase (GGDEF)-like protein
MGQQGSLPSQAGQSARTGISRWTQRRPLWAAAAGLLLVLGLGIALVAARAVARSDDASSKRQFRGESAAIVSRLDLAIQHEADLMIGASAFVTESPNSTNAQFAAWAISEHALALYPELLGIGFVRAGSRAFHCRSGDSSTRPAKAAFPTGFDYCAGGAIVAASLAARDSGRPAYVPIRSGKYTMLSVLNPVYKGAVIPTTLAGRHQAFLGWVGMSISPQVVLTLARGHHDTALVFRFHAGSWNAVFHGGHVPNSAHSVTTPLTGGWSIQTFAVLPGGGVFANADALALFLTGAALSLLVAALIFVLGTGRVRALRLVTERTTELRHQSLHDGLTGLANRVLIMDRIEQLLARNRRRGVEGAALFIDLDEFKNVNDTLGHNAGDQLLVAVAARLRSTLRDADTIGRMGGDEFVVLIDGGDLSVAPYLVAERLLDVMRQPFELRDARMPLTMNTSIGVAVGDRATAGELLRDADVALYEAKARGKNRYQLFHPEMQTTISQRVELEFDLRSALTDEQFSLVYQPTYNLEDLTVVGVEALLRWQHPINGLMQPDEFIPILEQTGQIREVGRWVLNEACKQMAAWRARGDALDVSVNVSGVQLDSPAIVEHIREALADTGLDPAALIIEVTETVLMQDAEVTAKQLHAIKTLGVRIAVDDFGTGYSSLAYLQQFPVDSLKIDRMFTEAIATSPESKALVGTLVQLGKDLGLTTLAEGVETPGQLDQLRVSEVNEIQGFLLSRPLDAETLETEILAPARATSPVSD